MKQLRVNVDELRVDAFAPLQDTATRAGTVLGRDATFQTRCVGNCTLDYSCGDPCA